jgi:hypothetical protein
VNKASRSHEPTRPKARAYPTRPWRPQ